MNGQWFEVWSDTSFPNPYLLVVQPAGDLIVVSDPALNNEIVFRGPNYQAARLWMLEDEFERVTGRVVCE
jgi:hypothetical protein